jgi:molybdate transport system ATP-binding protein
MSRIEVDLRVRRDRFVLEAAFASGGPWLGVVGPSGAGKSTLLEAIAGLIPSSGRVEVDGTLLQDGAAGLAMPAQERRTGFVFQGEALFPHLTVTGNLNFGMPDPLQVGAGSRFKEVVEVLDLEGYLDRYPPFLSGGQRRRVAVGRALLRGPRLLLLDEPLTGLDPALRTRVLDYLARCKARFDLPALLVSHHLEDVLSLADDLLVLEGGSVSARSRPNELSAGSERRLLATLLGFENIVDGVVAAVDPVGGPVQAEAAGGMRCTLPYEPLEPGDTLRFGLRAEDILLAARHPGPMSARNILTGRILALVPRGPLALVEVDCGIPLVAKVTAAAVSELGLKIGETVWVVFKTYACHYLDPPPGGADIEKGGPLPGAAL